MQWFIFALITAVSEATKDLFSKNAMKKVDPYVSAWSLSVFSFMFLMPLLLFIEIPVLGGQFWFAILIQTVMLSVTQVIYMRAISTSPLSVTLPMLAFTPAFMLITSPLILRESPGMIGKFGILLVVLGAYLLNVKKVGEGFLNPFKALFEERGPILMMVVAFIWSITANVDKIGVLNSSPIFYSITVMGGVTICLSIVMGFKSEGYQGQIKANWRALLPIGFFLAIGIASQMTAIKLTLAPFVISIKRTSIFFGSIYGFIFFKEAKIKERLMGAFIMVIGVFLITWF
jgi:drug/metabolite transporter (DMT)-like permease